MEYQTFKNEMLNYKRYKKSINELEQKIDDIIYHYCGVRAIRYDKESVSFNEQISNEMFHKMSEALQEPQKELDFTIRAIQRIEHNLSKLPKEVQEMAKMLYIDRYPLIYVGAAFGYSHNGVYQKIKREVEKI